MKKRAGWRKRESRHCSHFMVSVEGLFQVRKLPRNGKKKKNLTCWTVVPASHESHLFCVCTWFERHSRDCVKPKESPLELQKYKLPLRWQESSKMQLWRHVYHHPAQNRNSAADIPDVTQDFLIWYYIMRTETLAGITLQYFELEILQRSKRRDLHSSLLQNGIITLSPVCSWHEKCLENIFEIGLIP